MMRIICDVCGKELPIGCVRACLKMTGVVHTVADEPFGIGWDLCGSCAEKLYKGLLETKKALQAPEGTE